MYVIWDWTIVIWYSTHVGYLSVVCMNCRSFGIYKQKNSNEFLSLSLTRLNRIHFYHPRKKYLSRVGVRWRQSPSKCVGETDEERSYNAITIIRLSWACDGNLTPPTHIICMHSWYFTAFMALIYAFIGSACLLKVRLKPFDPSGPLKLTKN